MSASAPSAAPAADSVASRAAHAAVTPGAGPGAGWAARTGAAAGADPMGSMAHPAPTGSPRMPPLPDLSILPDDLPAYLEMVEREIIQRALAQTEYNRTQAAQLLGISFRQLRYQMQKLNISAPNS